MQDALQCQVRGLARAPQGLELERTSPLFKKKSNIRGRGHLCSKSKKRDYPCIAMQSNILPIIIFSLSSEGSLILGALTFIIFSQLRLRGKGNAIKYLTYHNFLTLFRRFTDARSTSCHDTKLVFASYTNKKIILLYKICSVCHFSRPISLDVNIAF